MAKSDSAVFLATFALTVLIDLTVAVQVGMVLAAVLFIKRISETTQINAVDESTETEGPHHSLVGKRIPEGVMVYRVFGAFFFGAADKLETALKRAGQEPEILILRMRKVLAMDATGLNALENLYEKLHAKGKYLILSGPHTQPLLRWTGQDSWTSSAGKMFAPTSAQPSSGRTKSWQKKTRRQVRLNTRTPPRERPPHRPRPNRRGDQTEPAD